jgi:cytochrome P450
VDDLPAQAGRFLSDPRARKAPEAFYRLLVTEAPVLRVGPVWLVSGYEAIKRLARHPLVTSDPSHLGAAVPLSPSPTLAALIARTLPVRDGADHRRLRRLAVSTFSAAGIGAREALIAGAIDELLAVPLAAGRLDVVADLAVPLPVAISCAILDIPAGDRARVLGWATLFSANFGRARLEPDEQDALERGVGELLSYVEWLCAERRRRPGVDLISELVAAGDHGLLDHDELVAFIVMLFANGLETLTAGLSLAVWELLQHPDLLERLPSQPELAGPLFDECLRLHSPVRASTRALTGDVELAGHVLRERNVAILFYAAGNRDPSVFSDPDGCRLDRASGHLALGHGVHFCLGAAVSRAAGKLVLRRLAERCRHLTTPVTPETLQRRPSFVFNALAALPVTFDPVAVPLVPRS